MTRRTFLFCDVCNPSATRVIELRRDTHRDQTQGRRISDGRAWFDGSPEEAIKAGWRILDDGRHVCPRCRGRRSPEAGETG